jgi:predicted membrane-bound mannosyltransferase
MQSNWLTRMLLSAAAYVAGRLLYLFFTHRHTPTWNELPSILESWIFFAIVYWILDLSLSGKRA